MSEAEISPTLVAASARRSRRIPIIWSVPLLAVALGLWLAWDTLSKRGPTITVSFNSAEGLQAGQSQLKYKDIVLGKVQSLRLTSDHSRVLVTIATTREAGPLLTEETVFWVATPRLFAGNVTGLETIISGPYVAMLPGTETGHLKREFVGREDPPILTTNAPGRTFLLRTSRLGSVSLGSPVFFRDLNVGEVLGWDIADMAESVTIRAFVRSPYDSYVHDQTRFWNASGVSLKLGSGGVELQLELLRALLLGGIAFETPAGTSPLAETDHEFPLFGDRTTADASSYARKIPLVSYLFGVGSGTWPRLGRDDSRYGRRPRYRRPPALRPRQGRGIGAGPIRGGAGAYPGRGEACFRDTARRGRRARAAGLARDAAEREPDHRATGRRSRDRAERPAGDGRHGRVRFRHAGDGERRPGDARHVGHGPPD